MLLEGIMLSEISQTEKDKHYDITYIWNKKMHNKLVKITTTTKKQTKRRTNQQLPVGSRNKGIGQQDVQTIKYKISFKGISYNTEYSHNFIITIN